MRLLFTAMMFSALASTAFAQANRQQKKDAAAIKALVDSVKVLSQADLSCDRPNDCTAVAVGTQPCGGPRGYIVVSRDNGNFNITQNLARVSRDKEDIYNRTYRVVSSCTSVRPPRPACITNVCR